MRFNPSSSRDQWCSQRSQGAHKRILKPFGVPNFVFSWLGNKCSFASIARVFFLLSNCVGHANRSASYELAPQSAAMDQSSQDALLCQTFKVGAGFAEPHSAQAYGSDPELATDKVI